MANNTTAKANNKAKNKKTKAPKNTTQNNSINQDSNSKQGVGVLWGLISLILLAAALIGFFFLLKFGLEYVFDTEIEFNKDFLVAFGVTFGLIFFYKVIKFLS